MEGFDVSTLVNYGALGLCLSYFIYKDNVSTKNVTTALQQLKEVVLVLKERVGMDGK